MPQWLYVLWRSRLPAAEDLDNESLKGNWVMAQKKLSDSALKNVLDAAVELLQDAEDVDDGTVTVDSSAYMRLRVAVKEATRIVRYRRQR